jgi:hypothetical protein
MAALLDLALLTSLARITRHISFLGIRIAGLKSDSLTRIAAHKGAERNGSK